MSKSVLERIVAGDLLGPQEIEHALEEAVSAWHDSNGIHVSLATYLGFTNEEYGAWAECYDALWLIIRARRDGKSLSEVARRYGKNHGSRTKVEARGARSDERERILSWLRRTGRVSGRR